MINEPDCKADSTELANLAQACLKHLDTRLKHSNESVKMLRTAIARKSETQSS
jgi:hypothetical protein